MISRTDIQCNIEKAKAEAYHILKISQVSVMDLLKKPGYQISLVHRKGIKRRERRLKDGIYALRDPRNKEKTSENEYTEFNEDFKDSYLYQIYCLLQQTANNRVGRFRLMWLNPKNCYSFHIDRNEPERFHLGLETNPYCFFLYKNSSNNSSNNCTTYQIPTDGYIYSVNAGKSHTFLNGGQTTRLHLLATLMDSKYAKAR